jgi:hypothetical protein
MGLEIDETITAASLKHRSPLKKYSIFIKHQSVKPAFEHWWARSTAAIDWFSDCVYLCIHVLHFVLGIKGGQWCCSLMLNLDRLSDLVPAISN